jgi:regulator of sigma E protease
MKTEWEGTVVDAKTAKHAYCNQSVWKRILISIAGPAMNVLLGFILMLVIVLMGGQNSVGTTVVSDFHVVYTGEEAYQGLQNGDYIIDVDGVALDSYAHLKQLVAEKENGTFRLVVQRLNEKKTNVDYIVLENVVLNSELIQNPFITNSLSEQFGLQKGDRVLKVNGTSVHPAYELSYELMMQGYRPISLTVIRAGQKLTLENVTLPNEIDPASGVTMGTMDFRVYGEADFHIGTVLKHTWFRSVSTVKMVFDSLFGLFSGRYGFEAVSGPVGITKTITEMAQLGYMYVINLVTVISINLGVMNLLPLPALDGGHLLIYAIEVIRRKPLKAEVEGVINFVGLVLLLSLAVIILIKDIIAL